MTIVGTSKGLSLVDTKSGAQQGVTMPAFGPVVEIEIRLARDERSIFFPIAVAESDIWLVTLGR